jgi:hypothetical protein
MAKLIEVTRAGGGYFGPELDTKFTINSDRIMIVVDVPDNEIGTSKILMDDKTEFYVTESRSELAKLINK